MTPKQEALNFLEGLKLDIQESEGGTIDVDSDDIKQIENCLEVIGALCPKDVGGYQPEPKVSSTRGKPPIKP